MKTTVALERDVARRLKAQMAQSGQSLDATINAALRTALPAPPRRRARKVTATAGPAAQPLGVVRDLDGTQINQLIADLEVEDYLRVLEQSKPA